jgi:small subunit ribosomal protein S20
MANTKAAKKAILTKTALMLIHNNDKDSETAIRTVIKTIDKLAAKGIIHKRTAARKKSFIMKQLHSHKVNPTKTDTKSTTTKTKAKATTKSTSKTTKTTKTKETQKETQKTTSSEEKTT